MHRTLYFYRRKLRWNLWDEQKILRWKDKVSEHWYHHSAELWLTCPPQGVTHHLCSWGRTQLWLTCKYYYLNPGLASSLLSLAKLYLFCGTFSELCCFSFACLLFHSMTLVAYAPLESLRSKDKRREGTTLCMPEPHQGTGSTITSSQAAASGI